MPSHRVLFHPSHHHQLPRCKYGPPGSDTDAAGPYIRRCMCVSVYCTVDHPDVHIFSVKNKDYF